MIWSFFWQRPVGRGWASQRASNTIGRLCMTRRTREEHRSCPEALCNDWGPHNTRTNILEPSHNDPHRVEHSLSLAPRLKFSEAYFALSLSFSFRFPTHTSSGGHSSFECFVKVAEGSVSGPRLSTDCCYSSRKCSQLFWDTQRGIEAPTDRVGDRPGPCQKKDHIYN